jgi:helix-turn-helix protein
MAKRKINKKSFVDYIVVGIQMLNIEDISEADLGMTYDDFDTHVDVERFIQTLSTPEVQILLLKYMGFRMVEIRQIMNMKNPHAYYSIDKKLRAHFNDYLQSTKV